jgi:hypothetical protein
MGALAEVVRWLPCSHPYLERKVGIPGKHLANGLKHLGPVTLLEGTVAQGLQWQVPQGQ